MTTRREFLWSAGAIAPLLAPFARTAFAAGETPKRIVFVYSPCGVVPGTFWPTGTDPTEKAILQPLAPHKNDVVVIKGLGYDGFNTPHSMGTTKALTNLDCFDKKPATATRGTMYGPSLDEILGKSIGTKTMRPVLRLGGHWGNNRGWLMFTNDGQPIAPIGKVDQAFEYLFGAATGATPMTGGTPTTPPPDTGKLTAMRDARQSVLDLITKDANSLRARLPRTQRPKMDGTLEAIRELEKQLGPVPTTGGGASTPPIVVAPAQCKNPALPIGGTDQEKQAGLIATAFGCDVTRIAVWKLIASADASVPGFGGFHDLSHETGKPEADAKLTMIHTWFAAQIAGLVTKLKATKDPLGTGSVFDNTVIYWMNECAHGNHDPRPIPMVLVGNAGGQWKSGRVVEVAKEDSNRYGNLLVSLANAAGDKSITTFGDPRWSTGPLQALVS